MSFLIHHYFFCRWERSWSHIYFWYDNVGGIVLNILIMHVEKSYFVKTGRDDRILFFVAFLQHDVAKLQHMKIFLLCFCNSIDWTKKLYSVYRLTLKNFSEHSILLQCFVENKLMLNKENVTWQWVQKIKSYWVSLLFFRWWSWRWPTAHTGVSAPHPMIPKWNS